MDNAAIRAILPGEVVDMKRNRSQHPSVDKTTAKKPRWCFRYMADVLVGPGQVERKEETKYLGYVSDIGKREAEKLRDEFLRTINRPEIVLPAQMLVSAVCKMFVDGYLPGLKAGSRVAYTQVIECYILPTFGSKRMCDVDRISIQAWIYSLKGLSKLTKEKILHVFGSVWERASEWDITQARNPCRKIRLVEEEGEIERKRITRALTYQEIRNLLTEADNSGNQDISNMLRIGLYCGLRIGEILALRYVDVVNGKIRVCRSRSGDGTFGAPKSKDGNRVLPLPPNVKIEKPATALATGEIFPYAYMDAYRLLQPIAKRAGIAYHGFAFHSLRHTYATLNAPGGASTLRTAMGHATEAQSLAYVHTSLEDIARQQGAIIDFLEAPVGNSLGLNSGKVN